MSQEVRVHFPERVWAAIEEYEPFPPPEALSAEVRVELRTAAVIRQDDPPPPTTFRIVTLSVAHAEQLLDWLTRIAQRRDAPRACRPALELVREGVRLAE